MLTKESVSSIDDSASEALLGPATLRQQIRSRFKIVMDFYQPWIDEAKEDYEFALGDQWSEDDRQALKKESRPCLTFNRIRPLINIISGYQREHSARIKVNPEGGEDKIFSEVMDKGLHFIDKVSHLTYTLGYQFDDGCYVGKSFIEAFKTYDKDPIRGELRFNLCSPYQIMPDPEFRGYDLNDGCRYCFKVRKYRKAELIELFPDKEKIIKGFKEDTDDVASNIDLATIEGDRDDYGNNPNRTTTATPSADTGAPAPVIEDDISFTLKEYWYLKRVTRWFVVDADSGDPKSFDKKDEAAAFAAKQGNEFKVIERKVNDMWVADMVCGVILQDTASTLMPDYDGYPFFRFLADWAPNAEKEKYRVQGMVRALKDPQREKNKAKSQALHILNTQANSGWIADDDALSPADFEKLERMGSKPGLIIKKKRGAELREILAKTQNQGQALREQQADEEFKQISNINPDLLGLQDSDSVSGKAMQVRIKQAILALSRLFSNYRYTKEILGNFILAMMPSIFDAKKLARVIGPDYMSKAIDPKKYPQGLSVGHLEAFLQMVRDDRYDLMVAEADAQSTIRYETFTELIELAKTGAPIPPDLFIDYMDMPNSDEVKQRVIQYVQQQMAAAAAKKGPAAP